MSVKGIEKVKRGYRVHVGTIAGQKTESAVYNVLTTGAGYADMMTPVDTGNLINSRYTPRIEGVEGKVSGRVGYTAAYAAAVHYAPGKLKGQPRAHFGATRAGQRFGGGTGVGEYWDPMGEPKFLEKGFEKVKPEIPRLLKDAYK